MLFPCHYIGLMKEQQKQPHAQKCSQADQPPSLAACGSRYLKGQAQAGLITTATPSGPNAQVDVFLSTSVCAHSGNSFCPLLVLNSSPQEDCSPLVQPKYVFFPLTLGF